MTAEIPRYVPNLQALYMGSCNRTLSHLVLETAVAKILYLILKIFPHKTSQTRHRWEPTVHNVKYSEREALQHVFHHAYWTQTCVLCIHVLHPYPFSPPSTNRLRDSSSFLISLTLEDAFRHGLHQDYLTATLSSRGSFPIPLPYYLCPNYPMTQITCPTLLTRSVRMKYVVWKVICIIIKLPERLIVQFKVSGNVLSRFIWTPEKCGPPVLKL